MSDFCIQMKEKKEQRGSPFEYGNRMLSPTQGTGAQIGPQFDFKLMVPGSALG